MGRGRSEVTIDLLRECYDILKAQHPISVRGVCYQLFVRKIIPSMARKDTARISHILNSALHGKTVLTIAHRKESLSNYDRIIEVRDGEVVLTTPRSVAADARLQ